MGTSTRYLHDGVNFSQQQQSYFSSLGCFVWLIRDMFGRFSQEEGLTSEEALVDEIGSSIEEKVEVEKEIECHGNPSNFPLPEEVVENEFDVPEKDVDVPENDNVPEEALEPSVVDTAPSSDVELIKSLAVQDVLDEVCQDIINYRASTDEMEVPVAPSAC